jgi:hypothetical protein
MGIVHVLTGPDHLSALATISVNVGNWQSFWYGVRWGIGHSIGLVFVGSIFILMSNTDNASIVIPEIAETVGETFVGLFMLALGIYSMTKAIRKWNNDTFLDEDMRRAMMQTSVFGDSSISSDSFFIPDNALDKRSHGMLDRGVSDRSISQRIPKDTALKSMRTAIFHDDDDDEDLEDPPLKFELGEASLSLADTGGKNNETTGVASLSHDHDHLPNMDDGISKQFLSICIGIIHGVAGPGGVLGVIPAVQLHNVFLSIIYLGSFCVTSTLVMGVYAASYGTCSSQLSANNPKFGFQMEALSALLSIIVGLLWLMLLYVGKLHDIFP